MGADKTSIGGDNTPHDVKIVAVLFEQDELRVRRGEEHLPTESREHLEESPLVAQGLSSVMLFGVLGEESAGVKDGVGSFASADENPVVQAIKLLKKGARDAGQPPPARAAIDHPPPRHALGFLYGITLRG